MLLGGRVLDPPEATRARIAMRELNETLARDPRVEVAMVAVADGITFARKL